MGRTAGEHPALQAALSHAKGAHPGHMVDVLNPFIAVRRPADYLQDGQCSESRQKGVVAGVAQDLPTNVERSSSRRVPMTTRASRSHLKEMPEWRLA